MELNELDFFDARLSFGNSFMGKGNSADHIIQMMKEAGISKAVAIMEEQLYCAPDTSIEKINTALSKYDSLYGLLTMASSCTGEMESPDAIIKKQFCGKTAGFLLCPKELNIPMRPIFLWDWFKAAQFYHIPVWYRAENNLGFEYIADVLAEYPQLTIVLSFADEWPNNRKVYPLLCKYPNVYLCLSDLIWMGGVEDFVQNFGSIRLLFSSNYPYKYPGASMLMLKNADIKREDKVNIAGKNLKLLLGGIIHDK